MENKTFAIRSQISAEDIIKIRKRLSLTQQSLADFMNERIKFMVGQIIRITGLMDFGTYISRLITIDAFF